MTDKLLILPFYLVADVSYSMTQQSSPDAESALAAANRMAVAVKDALDEAPLLRDKVRFSLIDFSDDARIQIPLCDLSDLGVDELPTLQARGGTSFAAAFKLLRSTIEADAAQLHADGHKVHRPAVFFLTDGEPTDRPDEWKSAFATLVDPNFRGGPNVIPFGVAGATEDTLKQLVHPVGRMRHFIASNSTDPADAIRSMAEILIGSIIASANSIATDSEASGFVLADDEEEDVWI